MSLTRRVRVLAWTILLAPIVVTSSSPDVPPGHCYDISGFVVRNDGRPVEDAAVVMLVWIGDFGGGWLRGDECCFSRATLTNVHGRYGLRTCAHARVDSVAAAVVTPDTIIVSQGYRVSRQHVTVDEVPETEDGFFCDDTEWRIENYVYPSVDSVTVVIP